MIITLRPGCGHPAIEYGWDVEREDLADGSRVLDEDETAPLTLTYESEAGHQVMRK